MECRECGRPAGFLRRLCRDCRDGRLRSDSGIDPVGFMLGTATGLPISPAHGLSTGAILGASGALLLATAPKLRPWNSTGGGKRERPRGSRIRSDDPLSATPDFAAPVGGPVPGVLPPAAFPAGNGAARNGQARNSGALPRDRWSRPAPLVRAPNPAPRALSSAPRAGP